MGKKFDYAKAMARLEEIAVKVEDLKQRGQREELLGLRMWAGRLHVEPKLPESWPGYEARMKAGDRSWQIRVRRGEEPEIIDSIVE